MIGVLGHNSALKGKTGPGTTWVNGMNFVMKHAPGAGLIARPVDQCFTTELWTPPVSKNTFQFTNSPRDYT